MKNFPVSVKLEKNGEVHEFPSLTKAAKFIGITPGELRQSRKTCRGFAVQFSRDPISIKSFKRPVFMFDLNGEFLERFSSVHECSRNTGFLPKRIWNSARQNHKCGKFIFRFTKDNNDTYDPLDFV